MKAHFLSLLCLFWASLVHGVYIIDDSNKTAITYVVGGPGTKQSDLWQHYNPSDPWSYLNATSFITRQSTDSGWLNAQSSLFIPFYGTGITLYGLRTWTHNASYVLDTQAPVFKAFDSGTDMIGNTTYNYTFYDVQDLPMANHTMKVTVFDHEESGMKGFMWFDYAVVNGPDVPPPQKGGSTNGGGGSEGNGAMEGLYYSGSGTLLSIVSLCAFALLLQI